MTKREKFRMGLRLLRMLFWQGIARLVPFRRRFRNIWLFAERGDEACDNAWALFRFVCEQMPEIRAYYLLTGKAPSFSSVRAVGRVLRKNSARHALLSFLPTVKISTHMLGATPDLALFASNAGRRLLHPAGKTVFLQHGVTRNEIPALRFPSFGVSLFVCAAAPEVSFVRERLQYPPSVARLLGFPRYDALLQSRPKRQIFLMPTWRAALSALSPEAFAKTAYAEAISSLLQSARLNTILRENDLTLVFAPHAEMRRFPFASGNDRICIVTDGIDAVLRESALLITDFSSVMFDFAFAHRPVLYWNAEGFREENYPDGWFDRARDGFGRIVSDETELLDALERAAREDFVAKAPYTARADRCFPVRDTENCRRVTEAIFALANGENP